MMLYFFRKSNQYGNKNLPIKEIANANGMDRTTPIKGENKIKLFIVHLVTIFHLEFHKWNFEMSYPIQNQK